MVSARLDFDAAPAVAAGIHEGRVQRGVAESRHSSRAVGPRHLARIVLGPLLLPVARRFRAFLNAPMLSAIAGVQESAQAEHASLLRRIELMHEQHMQAISARDAVVAALTEELRGPPGGSDESIADPRPVPAADRKPYA